MSRALEQALANWLGEAAVLRRRGHEHDAMLIEALIRDVKDAGEEYLVWLSEGEAMLRSNHAEPWLRRRFNGWVAQGFARQMGPHRQYLQAIIPPAGNVDAARAAGRRAAAAVEQAS